MTGPTQPPRVCLFVGVSLPPAAGRSVSIPGLEVVPLPPARQGDVLRALRHRPSLIALLDGAAPPAPSVSHKEILYAMEQGVRMLGAAGIGAIRAAELAEAGMDGIGEIYRWYRNGTVEADDEVALRYHPETFAPLTVPMVNLRHNLRRARARGIISPATAHAALTCARRVHFGDRTVETVLATLGRQIRLADVDKLRGFLNAQAEDLNQVDAQAVASALAASARRRSGDGTHCETGGGLRNGDPRVRCHPTVFLHRLRQANLPTPGATGDPPEASR